MYSNGTGNDTKFSFFFQKSPKNAKTFFVKFLKKTELYQLS